jgi:hypothetical protein
MTDTLDIVSKDILEKTNKLTILISNQVCHHNAKDIQSELNGDELVTASLWPKFGCPDWNDGIQNARYEAIDQACCGRRVKECWFPCAVTTCQRSSKYDSELNTGDLLPEYPM